MKIGQYCQRQRCKHVELEQFWQVFASRGFVCDSWAFLFYASENKHTTDSSARAFNLLKNAPNPEEEEEGWKVKVRRSNNEK